MRAALPALRQTSNGRVVNSSSVDGIARHAGFSSYNQIKFAVECLSEVLAQEVSPFGIKVMIVDAWRISDRFPRPFHQHRRVRAI